MLWAWSHPEDVQQNSRQCKSDSVSPPSRVLEPSRWMVVGWSEVRERGCVDAHTGEGLNRVQMGVKGRKPSPDREVCDPEHYASSTQTVDRRKGARDVAPLVHY